MSDLVVIEQKNVMTVFTHDRAIDPILEKIAKEARSFVGDVSTSQGRKDIASMAYKVAQTKTYLDGLGKALVDEMKELPKKVDASRKSARDFLDALKEEVRKPLDDWEAQQERVETEKKAAAEAEALAKQVEADHELALLMNAEFDRQLEEKRKAEAEAKIAHERRIAEEAAAKAKADAEEKALAEKQAAEKALLDAKFAQERAEREKVEAEKAAAQAKAEAEIRAKMAAEQAEKDKLQAIENERKRIEAVAEAERKAEEAREADKTHKKKINNAVLEAIVAESGINAEQGKAIIIAIASGKVPHLKISY
jgi:colicin import membrane protein